MTVEEVLRSVFALQAQDTRASRLAVRARSDGVDAAAVVRACNETRSIVRTWAMRGTLHMVLAEDVLWLVGLLGPIMAAGDRRRRLQLGLDDALVERSLSAISSILASSGPLTRADLMQKLAGKGVKVDPATNAAAHLCFYAAARGLICRGPDRPDDEPTYVLLEDWVGRPRPREPESALADLAMRYVLGHGPAAVEDFAAWSGLPLKLARDGFDRIASGLREVQVSGQRMWMVPAARAGQERGCTRLLGAFDPYLLGYRSREFALAPGFARRVQAGGGWIHPAVVADGRVLGTWRQQRAGDGLVVAVEPFERLDPAVMRLLQWEAADIGRFLGTRTTLIVSR